MTLCKCGCGKEVTKKENRYIRGHNRRGIHCSESHKKKIGKANKLSLLGKHHSEEHKKKIGLGNKGKKSSSFKDGKEIILKEHRKFKKNYCEINKECSSCLVLHHNPPLDYKEIFKWEGKLVTLCYSHHSKVHRNNFILSPNLGVSWTKKDTEKIIQEKF